MTETTPPPETLQLYQSQEHPCAYLPEKTARNLFIDPEIPTNPWLYGQLIDQGFRRSGCYLYRPHCPECQGCIATRIPVDDFQPRRSQRRIWRQNNRNISVVSQPAEFQEAHFALYQRYMAHQHPGGEMGRASPEEYIGFLRCEALNTQFFEFRLQDRLVAVAVTDILHHGLSAVYTFYDPDFSHLSPGVYAILWQIRHARQIGLWWLYLGYWVPGCRKMEYKAQYRPLQLFQEGEWREIPR